MADMKKGYDNLIIINLYILPNYLYQLGKGGSFIKQLKDESGAFIQISQKSKETTLPERVVTIIGEPNNNRQEQKQI